MFLSSSISKYFGANEVLYPFMDCRELSVKELGSSLRAHLFPYPLFPVGRHIRQ